MNKENKTFETNYVYDKKGNYELFSNEIISNDKPVTCLGLTFENEDARRAHFTEELRKKLQDPEFRKIEGFPIGEDEDILKLSDPPYYTACPNPWIQDFVEEWESQKPEKPADYKYHREPFAADVSEGKNHPIYNAHSYHTKVPHRAIMRYILHYTEPGDIVFDGFCGTGMTGVAAQMCGDREEVTALGYKVETDGTILQKELDERGKELWKPFSKLGARKAVLNDLSPAATFIAYNYNTPVDLENFKKKYKNLLKELKNTTAWMWETLHFDGKTKGKINYVVWSDIYNCPECLNEFTYYNEAFVKQSKKIEFKPEFNCPNCNILLSKNPSGISLAQKPSRVFENTYNPVTMEVEYKQKQVPILINYSVGTKRFEKAIDNNEKQKIKSINDTNILDTSIPNTLIINGDKSSDPFSCGIKYVHQFYSKRILVSLSKVIELSNEDRQLSFLVGSVLPKLTIMNRYMPQHGGRALVGPMANTLYVPPVNVENNVIDQIEFQFKKILKAFASLDRPIISTTAAQSLDLSEASLDYMFLDPPFGANIMYSELSYIRESWLKIFTNNKPEAIESKSQEKSIGEYRKLMHLCFRKAFKFLKPKGWITVEFSNTKASVWNSIQRALTEAGFIIASIATLDKTRGGFHAMIGPTAVKQDLVISAYKANSEFEKQFQDRPLAEDTVWDFIRAHLAYLPIAKKQDINLITNPERDPRILYDRLVAYYMSKNYDVPIDSKEFQQGLAQRFSEKDGLYFLPEQLVKYEKQKALYNNQIESVPLLVTDEMSAIAWLRRLLREKPQKFQDINPLFMQEINNWSRNEINLELSTLLEQSFLLYDGKGAVPSQIHSYLSTNWKDMRNLEKDDPVLVEKAKNRWYVPDPNKAVDLEQVREKALLKEFEDYKKETKKIKRPRLEAVRAGFKRAWQQKDYKTIINIAEKIPNNVLEEDPKLLMWYDQAITRLGDSL